MPSDKTRDQRLGGNAEWLKVDADIFRSNAERFEHEVGVLEATPSD
jgi:hypothetical protein